MYVYEISFKLFERQSICERVKGREDDRRIRGPGYCQGQNSLLLSPVSFVNSISRALISLAGDRSLLSLSGWESRRNAKKM